MTVAKMFERAGITFVDGKSAIPIQQRCGLCGKWFETLAVRDGDRLLTPLHNPTLNMIAICGPKCEGSDDGLATVVSKPKDDADLRIQQIGDFSRSDGD